jgi:hypothetical protein
MRTRRARPAIARRTALARPAGLAVAALTILAAFSISGCTVLTGSSNDPNLGGLLILAGKPGDTTLRSWPAGAPLSGDRTITTPDGTTWVAAGLADVLVAGLVDGSLRTSGPVTSDPTPAWRKTRAAGADGNPVEGPFYFPSWDPQGGRFAALAGDLDADARLTLVDPSTSSAFDIDLGRPVVAAPPAWVGPDLVAVAVGDATAPGSLLVDTTTGEATNGPSGGRLLATSADGSVIAIVGGTSGDQIEIRSTDGWLAGDGSSIGSIDAPPDVVAPTALALDPTGQRLAIAWLLDGGAVRVVVHDRASGWRRVYSTDLPDAKGAVVAWLR